MLIYEKKVDGKRKLFGTLANVRSEKDKELVYLGTDGNRIELTPDDVYYDNRRGGIVRKSDGQTVSVFIEGSTFPIIPQQLNGYAVKPSGWTTYSEGTSEENIPLDMVANKLIVYPYNSGNLGVMRWVDMITTPGKTSLKVALNEETTATLFTVSVSVNKEGEYTNEMAVQVQKTGEDVWTISAGLAKPEHNSLKVAPGVYELEWEVAEDKSFKLNVYAEEGYLVDTLEASVTVDCETFGYMWLFGNVDVEGDTDGVVGQGRLDGILTIYVDNEVIVKTVDEPTPDPEPVPVTLSYIEVVTNPTKTCYFENEKLSVAGIKVDAVYSDNSRKDITSEVTYSPVDGTTLTTLGIQEVTVSYQEQIVKFNIEVKKIELENIMVTKMPTKTQYYAGDTLDTTGIEVTASYSDGSTKVVTDECTFSPANGEKLLTVGDAQLVNVTHTASTKTTSFVIKVKYLIDNHVIKNITVTGAYKTEYTKGELFDPYMANVIATYEDGGSDIITSMCEFIPAEGTPINESQDITVRVTEQPQFSTTFHVTVVEAVQAAAAKTKTTKKEPAEQIG